MYRLPSFVTARRLSAFPQFPSLSARVSHPSVEHIKRLTDSGPSNHPDSALLPARVPCAPADNLSALGNLRPNQHARSQKTATTEWPSPRMPPPERRHSLPVRSTPGNR